MINFCEVGQEKPPEHSACDKHDDVDYSLGGIFGRDVAVPDCCSDDVNVMWGMGARGGSPAAVGQAT